MIRQPSDKIDVTLLPDGGAEIRDGNDPDSPVLRFNEAEWTAFVEGVRLGEFDFPDSVAPATDDSNGRDL